MYSESENGKYEAPEYLNSSELEEKEAKILRAVKRKKIKKGLEKPVIEYLEYGDLSEDEEGDENHGFIPWFCSLPGN